MAHQHPFQYRPALLVAASIALIAIMFWLVPYLTGWLGPTKGALAIFCLYWFGFCLPLGIVFQGRNVRRHLSLETGDARWVPWIVVAQVGLVVTASWFLLPDRIPPVAVVCAVGFGLLNGFLEEFFWRGSYLEQGSGRPAYQALGVALFTLWHVPLIFAQGVEYDGGPAALVFGAFGLGVFWAIIANRTNRIGWPILSHMATNAATFVGLFAVNFV